MGTTGRTIARAATKLVLPVAVIALAMQLSANASSAPKTAAAPHPVAAPVVRQAAARPLPPVPKPPLPKQTDEATFVVRRVLQVAEPIRLGQWYWDDAGVPAGPMVITADIAAGTLSAFRGGYEIGTTAIVYGADDKPTPLGVYPITQKDADHVSNLYDAPMPYMLRLTNDGVSIHGSEVVAGKGSNGCIGVPVPFAKRLFAAVKIGDPVIITNGRWLNVDGARHSS